MDFPSTHWSLLADASGNGEGRAQAALEELCRRYWAPVKQFLILRGIADCEAEDLTQEFLVDLTHSSAWRRADPLRGRFRSYLLGSLRRFVAHAQATRAALKRGGSTPHVPYDESADDALGNGGAGGPWVDGLSESAVRDFDRAWAVALMNSALQRVRTDYDTAGKAHLFNHLKPFLPGDQAPPKYERVATQLGLPVAAVTTEIHRLRAAFREAVRTEVAQTVSAPHEVNAELTWLQTVLLDRGSSLPPHRPAQP